MKFLISTLLCLIVSSVAHARTTMDEVESEALQEAEHFEFKGTNGTICILADFEAMFSLNLTYEGKMHTKQFSLAPRANFSVDGSCANGGDAASLTLSTAMEDLGFIVRSEKSIVKANLQYVLKDVAMLFPSINYTGVVTMIGEGDEFPDMGNKNSSYLCISPEVLMLKSNDTNVTATIEITFTNFKFQAFNVDKKYSTEVTECSGDTTSTTMTPTTSMPPAKGRGNYTVEDPTGMVCLRLEANITLEITMNGTMRMVRVPAHAEVNGTCGEMMSMMTLTFVDDEVEAVEAKTEGNLTFHFRKDQGFAFIETVAFDLTFANETNGTVQKSAIVHDVLGMTNDFYTCPEEDLSVGGDHVILQDLQIQAFDLDKGAFSPNGIDCNAAPSAPTDSNYTVSVGNVTCISLSGALQLEIPYVNKDNKNMTQLINITKDQPPTGSCGGINQSMSEHITIQFKKDNFFIQFDFAKDGGSSSMLTAGDDFSYFVQNITVMYTLTNEFFPDAKNPGVSNTVADTMQTLYKTAGNMYYKCDTDQTVNLPNGVNLMTKDFKFVAFHTSATPPDLNSDNANECAADTETNSIVPIAVGAALAGLVVIVLIAYLIGRRRSHKGYESV